MDARRHASAALLVALALIPLGAFSATAAEKGASAQTLTDPYEILHTHYEAIGGLEKLKMETTSYFEGRVSIAGLNGTIRQWHARAGRHRTEVDLSAFQQTTGDNGDVSWEIDTNGKLRIERDESALAAREVARRREAFEHLDRQSQLFTVALEGTQEIEGIECYVVKTANSIDGSYILEYIETSTFLLRKASSVRDRTERHTLYSEYRETDGILRAFSEETQYLPIGQTQTLKITEYRSDIEIDPAIFDPPEEESEDFVFRNGGNATRAPFRFIENHLFVAVTINCRETLWALDTGASATVIDSAYAADLGLKSAGTAKGMAAGHMVEVSFVTLPPYSVPGIDFSEQKVASMGISDLFRRTTDLEVAGVLGYDFLSRFVTRIDYADEMLVFYRPDTFEYLGDGTVLDAPLRHNVFTVNTTVDGRHSGRWSLDIGASGISFHYPFAEGRGLLDRPGIEGIGFGAGGKLARRTSKFSAIEFAGHTLDEPRIALPTEDVVGALGESEIIGTLGNTLFRHFVLYLDYSGQRVIVERGAHFGRDFPFDRSGLMLWRPQGEAIEVLSVASDTPADEGGFEEGDTVESINGIDVAYLSGLIAIRELLREEPGTTYTVGVLRDGVRKELTLTLRELL